MVTAFSLTEGVSVLMDAFKQFANKNIFECAKDGFPDAFLRCTNPQAAQSSINDDVSKSEPGRNYMQATYKLGPVSFPSSYGEYAAVRIAVFLQTPLRTLPLLSVSLPPTATPTAARQRRRVATDGRAIRRVRVGARVRQE
jgi:hypothetical protein